VVYPASLFSQAEASQIYIHGVAFRVDETVSSTEAFLPSLEIYLSTFRGSFSDIYPFPAGNRGDDRALLFSAENLRLSAPGPSSPADFGLQFTFEKPFLYDRNSGQLVLDFISPTRIGEQLAFDLDVPSGAEQGRVLIGGGWGGGVLTADFLYSPVPEPGVVTIFLVGGLIFSLRRFQALGLVVICACRMAAAAATNTLVVPIERATQFGEGAAAVYDQFQQVYPASLFGHAEASQIYLHGVAFRVDENLVSTEATFPRLDIYLSTFRGSFSEIYPFPNGNWGEDRVLLFSAENFRVSLPGASSTADFGLEFTFDKPFLYDRNAGQLVLDIISPTDLGTQLGIDAGRPAGDEPGRMLTLGGWGAGVLTTEFLYSPVPEPRVLAIALAGLLPLMLRFRRFYARALAIISILGIGTAAAATNSLVVPPELANAFGGGNAVVYDETQVVYPASLFGQAEASQIYIHGVAFRGEESLASTEAVLPSLEIYLSTFRGPFSGIYPFPGGNRGADRTLLFSAQNLRISAPKPASPSDFGISFTFEKPFLYDRNAGQLVLDFITPLDLGDQFALDLGRPAGNEEGRTLIGGGWGGGVLTAEFLYSPVPEPRVVTLFLVAGIIFCLKRFVCK
jgi:hypothetical protein